MNSSIKLTIQQFFYLGMDRIIQPLLPEPNGLKINLGPGEQKIIPGTVGVGLAGNRLTEIPWKLPDPLPFRDEEVAVVHAHHFLEHFTGEDAVQLLMEIQRILMPGGIAYVTVPYQGTLIAGQSLDHKSIWNEETWRTLFKNDYHNDNKDHTWQLSVHACFIMGIVIRNLSLFTQLVKE